MCQSYRADWRLWHQKGACGKGQHPGRGAPLAPLQNQGRGQPPPPLLYPASPATTAPKPEASSSAPSPDPLRHFSRSSLPHSPRPAQAPSKAGRGHLESPPRSSTAVRLPRTPGSLSGQNPRFRPAPRRSSPPLRQGSPGAAHLSQGPAPTRSPPPRQAAGVRGAGCDLVVAPHDTPTCLHRLRARWSASPSCRSCSLGFPPLSVRSECQRGVPPPAPLRQTGQGLRRLRHQPLAARVSGRGAEGYGTNGLGAPSQAHRSSDPEGAGPGGAPGGGAGPRQPAQPALPAAPPGGDQPLPPVAPQCVGRWALCGGGQGREVGRGRAGGAADGYRPPLGGCVRAPPDCSVSAPLPSPCAPAILPGRRWERGCGGGPPPFCFPPSRAKVGRKVWEGAPREARPPPLF